MKSLFWILRAVLTLGVAGTVPGYAAEPEGGADQNGATSANASSENAPEPAAAESSQDTGHGLQFGLRAAIGTGYRVVFRYENSAYCDDDPERKFCGFGGAPTLDLAASFAPLDGIEPFVWARLGLGAETQTNTDALQIVGAGVRIYTMSDAPFKIFIEPAVGVEFEGGGDSPRFAAFDYKTDFQLRLAAGAQYDFSRYMGLYVGAGLGVGVTRAIHTTLDIQGGLQFRAP